MVWKQKFFVLLVLCACYILAGFAGKVIILCVNPGQHVIFESVAFAHCAQSYEMSKVCTDIPASDVLTANDLPNQPKLTATQPVTAIIKHDDQMTPCQGGIYPGPYPHAIGNIPISVPFTVLLI